MAAELAAAADVDAAAAVAVARLTSMARVIMGSTFIALTTVSRTHSGKAIEQARCRHQTAADGEEERSKCCGETASFCRQRKTSASDVSVSAKPVTMRQRRWPVPIVALVQTSPMSPHHQGIGQLGLANEAHFPLAINSRRGIRPYPRADVD